MGLMATLVALTLGLLIQSASLYRTTVETEYRQILAGIVHLDEYLQAYGPGASGFASTYGLSPRAVSRGRWPNEDFGPTGPMPDGAKVSSPTFSGKS